MAATTRARGTKRLGADVHPYDFWIAAATKINGGAIACLNADGLLVPGDVATDLVAVGRARATYDNSTGLAQAFKCAVESGIFLYNNATAGDLIVVADIGKDCWIIDDQTVGKTDGAAARSKAGKIIDVTTEGVWVQLKHAS